MSGERQLIPARHGTATFVPRGYTIKIINTYGKQVIDTWAFALHQPPSTGDDETAEKVTKEKSPEATPNKPKPPKLRKAAASEDGDQKKSEKQDSKVESKEEKSTKDEQKSEDKQSEDKKSEQKTEDKKEEESEEKPSKGKAGGDDSKEEKKPEDGEKSEGKPQSSWKSYLPSSLPSLRKKIPAKEQSGQDGEKTEDKTTEDKKAEDKKTEDKKTQDTKEATPDKPRKSWSDYIPSGRGFTSYLPSKGTISAFAGSQWRDPDKSYAEQLYEFSKTPVGAATLSAATGSGALGATYAAYSAYVKMEGQNHGPMEYMSMPHSRAATCHMTPRVNDTLVSNLREPLLTLIEDTSPGIHDTLVAACDPQRYKGLGVEKWEEHGSCAENLVLALKELNEKAGLKGAKSVGSDVTVNNVPAPLNLFMNIPWDQEGNIKFERPKGKKGDYVRFRAERDLVVVMSACPQDVLPINNQKPMVGHFIVEEAKEDATEESKEGETSEPKEKEKKGPAQERRQSKPAATKTQKEEPKAEPKDDQKKDTEQEAKSDTQQESKSESKDKAKPTPKADKTAAEPESKEEAKPQEQTEAKPKTTEQPKSESKEEPKPEGQSAKTSESGGQSGQETPKKKPKKLQVRHGSATPSSTPSSTPAKGS